MTRSQDRMLAIAAAVLGVALLVVAVVYWTETACALPGSFPATRPDPRLVQERPLALRVEPLRAISAPGTGLSFGPVS
jgi:hypothetical protein